MQPAWRNTTTHKNRLHTQHRIKHTYLPTHQGRVCFLLGDQERHNRLRLFTQHTGKVGLGSTTGVDDVANKACSSWAREVATGAPFADDPSMGVCTLTDNTKSQENNNETGKDDASAFARATYMLVGGCGTLVLVRRCSPAGAAESDNDIFCAKKK